MIYIQSVQMEDIQNNKLITQKITCIDIYGFHIYKGEL